MPGDTIVNALTVDVEDYFQVSAFERLVPRSTWGTYESRVVRNTMRLLDLFDEYQAKGTFFVLGWVAENFPSLVREIHSRGHELASHSHQHRLVYELTPAEFRDDLRRAGAAIASASGVSVTGYRAPSFSITARSMWALDVLAEEGYTFDSSIYPIHHDRYGVPDWHRDIRLTWTGHGGLWELPGSTVRVGNVNLPIGGGGYFRLLPYAWTRMGMARLNRHEQQPAIFYLHPWEIDPEQPRIAASLGSRIRHYTNLGATETRLRQLLRDFKFAPIHQILADQTKRRTNQPQPG